MDSQELKRVRKGSTAVQGSPRQSTAVHGSPQKSMEVHGSPRHSATVHGSPQTTNLTKSIAIIVLS